MPSEPFFRPVYGEQGERLRSEAGTSTAGAPPLGRPCFLWASSIPSGPAHPWSQLKTLPHSPVLPKFLCTEAVGPVQLALYPSGELCTLEIFSKQGAMWKVPAVTMDLLSPEPAKFPWVHVSGLGPKMGIRYCKSHIQWICFHVLDMESMIKQTLSGSWQMMSPRHNLSKTHACSHTFFCCSTAVSKCFLSCLFCSSTEACCWEMNNYVLSKIVTIVRNRTNISLIKALCRKVSSIINP